MHKSHYSSFSVIFHFDSQVGSSVKWIQQLVIYRPVYSLKCHVPKKRINFKNNIPRKRKNELPFIFICICAKGIIFLKVNLFFQYLNVIIVNTQRRRFNGCRWSDVIIVGSDVCVELEELWNVVEKGERDDRRDVVFGGPSVRDGVKWMTHSQVSLNRDGQGWVNWPS